MFIYEYEHEYGEDRFGMVGRFVDPFQENVLLNVACSNCQSSAMIIAERNVVNTNLDGSPCYQIVLVCPQCHSSDEFSVNQGKEGIISKTKHSHIQIIDTMIGN
ncbi:hypothetical protein LOOC260_100170 [Paucilactobacillus hokkaidonensis JCM 18461]|uniref:Uncharacterized protein n=1 Tax=Paucilactobacillus hokkaidonensis JCM 18461 TaxID=1291742 RepID=A0A0A1GQL1_9LACO|nr:hypothetical protein [Paucilactobacillus hokkaidonensis]BAP84597.1 hypothetical protein LOOC260_100170 [Paucilactobacillus hokkaidonensis JCM 18461]